MKPPPFEYVRPDSLTAAIEALSLHGSDSKLIAGGQSLMPMLAFRMAAPSVLIDIGRLTELRSIGFDAAGLSLGALVRWCDIEQSERIGAEYPLLAAAIRHVAHYQIRNRGTVGGSLAHADPAAEMPAIALACDANIKVAGSGGTRVVAAADFFIGALTTVLESDELITGIVLPPWPPMRRWAFEEFSRRRGDFALAGVALHFDLDEDGALAEPHVAGFGIAETPVRLKGAEAALRGRRLDEDSLSDSVAAAAEGLDITADIHAPADYRTALLGTLLERALRRAGGLRDTP